MMRRDRTPVAVLAKRVKPGHSIPGLDNGYVVEVVKDTYDVEITFHTAEGDEAKLIVPKDVPITVDDIEPDWVGY